MKLQQTRTQNNFETQQRKVTNSWNSIRFLSF